MMRARGPMETWLWCSVNRTHENTRMWLVGAWQWHLVQDFCFMSRSFHVWESAVAGLPWWLSGKEPAYQCKRCRFDPWVGKILWRRKWQHTPVFSPGKSHEQRTLSRLQSVGSQRVRHNLATKQQHFEKIYLFPFCLLQVGNATAF